MPTYEYKCPKCGTEFEAFQKITSKPGATCPKCAAKATRQMSAGAGLVFRGSGFYLTDYGRSGQKARKDGEGAAPSGDTSGGAKAGGEMSGGERPGGEKPSESASSGSKPAESKPAESKSKPKKKDN